MCPPHQLLPRARPAPRKACVAQGLLRGTTTQQGRSPGQGAPAAVSGHKPGSRSSSLLLGLLPAHLLQAPNPTGEPSSGRWLFPPGGQRTASGMSLVRAVDPLPEPGGASGDSSLWLRRSVHQGWPPFLFSSFGFTPAETDCNLGLQPAPGATGLRHPQSQPGSPGDSGLLPLQPFGGWTGVHTQGTSVSCPSFTHQNTSVPSQLRTHFPCF